MTNKPLEKSVNIDGEIYDIPSDFSIALSTELVRVWVGLGQPTDLFTVAGDKMMKVIIASWEDAFPAEAASRREDLISIKSEQMTTKEQIKGHTGRQLASIPYYIMKLMKAIFKENKLGDRENMIKLVKLYPMFSLVEKV